MGLGTSHLRLSDPLKGRAQEGEDFLRHAFAIVFAFQQIAADFDHDVVQLICDAMDHKGMGDAVFGPIRFIAAYDPVRQPLCWSSSC